MLSRLVAVGFCALDMLATLLTILHGSATMVVIALSLAISIGLACCSSLVRSVLWPTYFWDEVRRDCRSLTNCHRRDITNEKSAQFPSSMNPQPNDHELCKYQSSYQRDSKELSLIDHSGDIAADAGCSTRFPAVATNSLG